MPNNFNEDSFYQNNDKLSKKIIIKLTSNYLKKYCLKLSKFFFKT